MKTRCYCAIPGGERRGDYIVVAAGETVAAFSGAGAESQAREEAASRNAAEWQHIQGRSPLTRYVGKGGMGFVTIDQAEAQRLCDRLGGAFDDVEVTPGLTLLDNGSHEGEQKAIWSDGRLTRPVHNVPALGLAGDVRRLVRAALGHRSEWGDHWQELLTVASVAFEQVAANTDRRHGLGWHSANDVTLYRVTLSNYPTVWLVTMAGGALSEDGDAWSDELLFADETDARRQYEFWCRL